MPNIIHNVMKIDDGEKANEVYAAMKTEESEFDFNAVMPVPAEKEGDEKLEWCTKNWGSKWNAMDPVMLDDRRQFVIRLIPDKTRENALHNGLIYIDQETLAFSRIELSLDMSDPDKATHAMLVKKPNDIRFRPKEMSLLLNYKREGDLSRLSYVRTVFRFDCDARRRLVHTEFTAISEMVVTNRFDRADVAPIDRAESFRSSESLADKTQAYADPDFWKDYNIIEPTESLENAIGRLKKQ